MWKKVEKVKNSKKLKSKQTKKKKRNKQQKWNREKSDSMNSFLRWRGQSLNNVPPNLES